MAYTPRPIDTSHVALSPEVAALVERLAENAHDRWAQRRLGEGWTLGPRNDAAKTHPCLIPYADLPESEKQYDRDAAVETIKVMLALGFRIAR